MIRILEMEIPGSAQSREVTVHIGVPEPDPLPGGDFRVLVQIQGADEPYSRHVCGVDEIQALLSACALVPAVLPTLAPANTRFTWLGDEDLGFSTS